MSGARDVMRLILDRFTAAEDRAFSAAVAGAPVGLSSTAAPLSCDELIRLSNALEAAAAAL